MPAPVRAVRCLGCGHKVLASTVVAGKCVACRAMSLEDEIDLESELSKLANDPALETELSKLRNDPALVYELAKLREWAT